MFRYSRTTINNITGQCTEKYWSEPENGDALTFIQSVWRSVDVLGQARAVASNKAVMVLSLTESTLIYAEDIPE